MRKFLFDRLEDILAALLFFAVMGGAMTSSQKIESRETMILVALKPETLGFVNEKRVTPDEHGYVELYATLMMVEHDMLVPSDTVEGLRESANSADDGLKNLIASYIWVKSGRQLSDKAMERTIRMANGKPPFILGDARKLAAIDTVLACQEQIRKKQAQ